MLTDIELNRYREVLKRLTVHPAIRLIDGVEFELKHGRYYVELSYYVEDIYGEGRIHLQTEFAVANQMSVADLLMAARNAVLYIVVHELDECLMFDGEGIFNPHGWPAKEKPKTLWLALGRNCGDDLEYAQNGPVSEATSGISNFGKKEIDASPSIFTRPIEELSDEEFLEASSLAPKRKPTIRRAKVAEVTTA